MSTRSKRFGDLSPDERRAVLRQLLADRAARELPVDPLPVVVPVWGDEFEPFPLTDVQLAYWVGRGGLFELGNVGAHVYLEFDLPGGEVGRVGPVWRALVERHGMLRAVVRSDGLQQVLASVPEYEVGVLDLRGCGVGEELAALAGVREELSHQLLPADRWPLFELRVSLLGDGRMRLHLSVDLLVVDFMSIQILLREALALFLGEGLPELELSFRDYVLAERGLAGSGRARRAEAYWRERLPGLPGAPELPLARAPASVERPRFRRRQARLEREEWSVLKEWGREVGLTPSALLLAAFAEVLAVWSGADRFTVNLTLFNRLPLHPQVGGLVGDFTSLTLLAVEPEPGLGFLGRARAVQERLWSDLDHREFSGVRVLRELVREGGQGAVMPVVFTSTLTQGLVEAESAPPEVPVELVYAITQTPQVWLDHQVSELGGALLYSWDAVEELFPEGVLDSMFAAYRGLLERLLAGPAELAGERLRRLVPAAELESRAHANATRAPRPSGLLQDGFLACARERPQACALAAPGLRLSYAELQGRVSALARELRARGLRPGRLAAVVLEKGWEQALAVLAVLEAGGAYLPLDPGLPAERLQQLLAHGQVELVLTQAALARSLAWPPGLDLLALDEWKPGEAPEPLPPVAAADELAYVIYTSGSTGLPKGVMVEHRAALATIAAVNRRFAVGPDDRVLALSALSFDLSVYDLLGTLAAGGTVVYPQAERERDPAHWLELVQAERVTVWNSVPALARLLVEEADRRQQPLPDSLRLLLLSGDWIPLPLAARLRSLLPQAELVSLGGATEAGIWSVYHPIEQVEPHWASVPYGRPLANQRLHVLDQQLEPRPLHVPGQLYIAGDALARGYWRDPERTQASFIHHPQSRERLYRTGDLARYHPDGSLEFLGREDTQIKLHGYRIELGEIETALSTHPGVRTAVVTAPELNPGQPHLHAYYLPNSQPAPTPEQLHTHLSTKLPHYMIPHHYQPLDHLPLTTNGKINHDALPKPDRPASDESAGLAPRDPVELELTRIWEEVLDVAPIGIRDDFFALGGDSLAALIILGRLRETFGDAVSPVLLLRGTTVEQLASILRGEHRFTADRAIVRLEPQEPRALREAPFVCVHPADGSVGHYRELALRLGAAQEFIAIQSLGGGEETSGGIETIDALAIRYADEIRTVAADAPYTLGGWSMGGVVALELGRALHAEGAPPRSVAVFDADLGMPYDAEGAGYLADVIVSEYQRVFGAEPELASALEALEPAARLSHLLERARESDLAPASLDDELFRSLTKVFFANVRAYEAYEPASYLGHVTLFLAAERPAASADACRRRWEEIADGGLDVYEVPGDHYSMLRAPHVDVLAARLADCLARAQGVSARS